MVLSKLTSVDQHSRKLTYVHTLVRDTSLDIQDLKTAMLDPEIMVRDGTNHCLDYGDCNDDKPLDWQIDMVR